MIDAQPFLVAMTSVVLSTAVAIEAFIGRMALQNRNRIVSLEAEHSG
jgi:hypothetical protein